MLYGLRHAICYRFTAAENMPLRCAIPRYAECLQRMLPARHAYVAITFMMPVPAAFDAYGYIRRRHCYMLPCLSAPLRDASIALYER